MTTIVSRLSVVVLAALLAFSRAPARAQDSAADALYQAKLFVTGQREATRAPAIRDGLGIVLAKLSGDPSIVHDPRTDAMTADVSALVHAFSYRDLLAYRPVHDEQGTYDRPYELTVTFDHAAIDKAVRALGRVPWLAPRPRLLVVLAVENFKAHYVLSGDSDFDRSADLREAIVAAADRTGVTIAFPLQAQVAAGDIATDAVPLPQASKALAQDGDAVLAGHIAFNEEALSWVEHWRLDAHDTSAAWMTQHETFDDAFRAAMRDALPLLARGFAAK